MRNSLVKNHKLFVSARPIMRRYCLYAKYGLLDFNKLSSLEKFTKSLHMWRKVYLHLYNIEEVLDFRKLLDWMG